MLPEPSRFYFDYSTGFRDGGCNWHHRGNSPDEKMARRHYPFFQLAEAMLWVGWAFADPFPPKPSRRRPANAP